MYFHLNTKFAIISTNHNIFLLLNIVYVECSPFVVGQGAGEDGGESLRQQTPYQASASPVPPSPGRGVSSAALTNKTGGEESNKGVEVREDTLYRFFFYQQFSE